VTATVHALPRRSIAHLAEVHYDSVAGEWTLVITEHPTDRHAHAEALPAYVRDALADFLDGAAA